MGGINRKWCECACGCRYSKIIEYTKAMLDQEIADPLGLYGGGHASQNIVNILASA